jgi:sec-independent protein translocase protein TatB
MPQISPLEILVVSAIALIVFGPDKLPQIARTIGRGLSELRRMASDVKQEFEEELYFDDDEDEERPRVHRPTTRRGMQDDQDTPRSTGDGDGSPGREPPDEPPTSEAPPR